MTKLQKVLIVDGSRLVRASLSKLLRGDFEVCEERDAESAWQSLVLDSSIIAVFSGLDITTLEGAGLVERLRASKLGRLNGLPFFLLISDSFTEAARGHALAVGVSAFIPKRTAGPEFQKLLVQLINPDLLSSSEPTVVVAEYGSQSEVGLNDLMLCVDSLPDLSSDSPSNETRLPESPNDGVGDRAVQQAISSIDDSHPCGVLVFGLDGYEDFRRRYGWDLADKIVQRIFSLLASKIHADESMQPLVGGRIAIISSVAGREQCEKFARSVCQAVAGANISIRGERVGATVSAGLAALPEDSAATTTDELMHLAISRHDAASLSGGNKVVFVTGCGGNSINQDEFFERLKVMLSGTRSDTMMSCKGWIGSVCKICRKLRATGEAPLCQTGNAEEKC